MTKGLQDQILRSSIEMVRRADSITNTARQAQIASKRRARRRTLGHQGEALADHLGDQHAIAAMARQGRPAGVV
jgi:hypothetical protein